MNSKLSEIQTVYANLSDDAYRLLFKLDVDADELKEIKQKCIKIIGLMETGGWGIEAIYSDGKWHNSSDCGRYSTVFDWEKIRYIVWGIKNNTLRTVDSDIDEFEFWYNEYTLPGNRNKENYIMMKDAYFYGFFAGKQKGIISSKIDRTKDTK